MSASRLSAYFAFGLQWGSPAQSARADDRSATGRVIDVTARPVDPEFRKTPDPIHQRRANIFLDSTQTATYAPPAQPGQSVRLIPSAQPLGQNLDSWA